jgi:hypothetical protein
VATNAGGPTSPAAAAAAARPTTPPSPNAAAPLLARAPLLMRGPGSATRVPAAAITASSPPRMSVAAMAAAKDGSRGASSLAASAAAVQAPASPTKVKFSEYRAPKEAHGFELVREQYVREYDSHVALYRHKKTGAELMSAVNGDENKTFGAVFRTPVGDSTGIPHILEHSVLCGSRK